MGSGSANQGSMTCYVLGKLPEHNHCRISSFSPFAVASGVANALRVMENFGCSL